MKQKIIENIDSMIGYLQLIKEEVANGTPERVDSLDLLQFISVGLEATYNNIKQHFHIEEDSVK